MAYGDTQFNGPIFGEAQQQSNSAQGVLGGDAVRPYLAELSEMADEAQRAAEYVQGFIDRCRGGPLQGVQQASTIAPVPSGHLGQLDRLQSNLGHLNELARELQTIG